MTNAAYLESIEGACPEGIAWVKKQKITSDSQAWKKLHRSDWMIWLAEKRGIWNKLDPTKLRLFACDCAEQVLPIYEKDYPHDKRPRKAVETARLFAEGKATQKEWDAARYAAWTYQAARLRLYFPDPFEESK